MDQKTTITVIVQQMIFTVLYSNAGYNGITEESYEDINELLP